MYPLFFSVYIRLCIFIHLSYLFIFIHSESNQVIISPKIPSNLSNASSPLSSRLFTHPLLLFSLPFPSHLLVRIILTSSSLLLLRCLIPFNPPFYSLSFSLLSFSLLSPSTPPPPPPPFLSLSLIYLYIYYLYIYLSICIISVLYISVDGHLFTLPFTHPSLTDITHTLCSISNSGISDPSLLVHVVKDMKQTPLGDILIFYE